MGSIIELCRICDEPTGQAGAADDSLFCEVCGIGPLCNPCRDDRYENEVRCRADHGEDT